MAYHINIVKAILTTYGKDPTIALDGLDKETVNRADLFTLWFCKYGWSASDSIRILEDIDKREGMIN